MSESIFSGYTLGLSTSRDAWVYNSSQSELLSHVKLMISVFNEQVEGFREYRANSPGVAAKDLVESFIDRDSTRISWSRGLKGRLAREDRIDFDPAKVRTGVYRQFEKRKVYFDTRLTKFRGKWGSRFPLTTSRIWASIASGWVRLFRSRLGAWTLLLNLHLTGARLAAASFIPDMHDATHGGAGRRFV